MAAFTDLWRARVQFFNPIVPTLLELHQKYGSVVRIGPNTISLSDPGFVKLVYSARNEFTKADSYGPMRVFIKHESVGSIIDMQDDEQNRVLKKAVGALFNSKNLAPFESVVESILEDLAWKVCSASQQPFNLYEVMQLYQLDFLIKIAFSENAGHLRQGQDVMGLAKLGFKRVSHWYSWQPLFCLERFIFQNRHWSGRLAGPSKWAVAGADRLKLRQQHAYRGIERNDDLLQGYIRASEKYPDTLRAGTIVSLVNSTVSAGADTTAGTMSTILYLLMKHSRARECLLKELQDARSQGRISAPIRYVEVERLPYLDAVVKEALRLNPPLAVPLERVVPAQGCSFNGLKIPGGTIVGCTGTVIHLNQCCFGDDADQFRPERWLNRDNKDRLAMEQAFLAWGAANSSDFQGTRFDGTL
ncbi:uncharacterized protein JN550_005268 [Neoarthrinium moseri]|uniref:uncharacterized protein n=1 Tax=Neoarthrinium moseri TaxID=1658444 RepID=UPI001FDCB5B0|nr:uncharacterized protein JN550_005268 [Neoarthrinium moseri]KAI1870340.1 hypothetical protein JN550_005268 [Neoarthrinium moseri]